MYTLLRFTIENFRSIAERKTMVFTPTSIKDEPSANIVKDANGNYLRTTAIYGANSSGKSNLIQGLSTMAHLVQSSIKMHDKDELQYEPFLLNKANANKPTLYEVEFVTNGICYRYGFSNTDKQICEEWLIRKEKSGRESNLFIRTLEGIGVNEKLFHEGENLEEKTNNNRLFISLVGQLGGKVSNSVIHFFQEGINVLSGLDTNSYNSFTKSYLNKNAPGCGEMKSFFKRAQLGFKDVVSMVHDIDVHDLPKDIPNELREELVKDLQGKKQIKVFSSHGIYNEDGTMVATKNFEFDEMESAGTRKLFDMAGPIFDTLNSGSVIVIDELDAKMHPLISQELVSLFNDPNRNLNCAQLIFSTHDTNLLSIHLLRRDQIWFTEKDAQERTDIYNMMQIVLPDGSKPRGDGNIGRNYINGRYGGIPYISQYTE